MLVSAHPASSSLTCLCSVMLWGARGVFHRAGWVRRVEAGLQALTDPAGLQPSAPVPVPPEAHHDVGGGSVAGRAGMAAQKQL